MMSPSEVGNGGTLLWLTRNKRINKKMTELEFCPHIEYICAHDYRHMWLRTGSFNEVLAYLEGYANGAQVERHGHHTFTVPFCHWLAIKFSGQFQPKYVDCNILYWDEYREIFPDEEEAIANLPILYREFAESEHLKNLGY